MERYLAIRCTNCGDVLISRARHDWNTCSCFKNEDGNRGCYIDGDSCVGSGGYIRVGGNPERFHVDLPLTSAEMVSDWCSRRDKFKTIDIDRYPLIMIDDATE